MDQEELTHVKELIQEAREQLLIQEEEPNEILISEGEQAVDEEDEEGEIDPKQEILVNLVDQLFDCLEIQTEKDLFGVPPALQKPLFIGIKQKIAQGLMGIYQLDHKMRHHVVAVNPMEHQLPTSEVASAILALTRYTLDKATDVLTQPINGELRGIVQFYSPLTLWLSKQGQKDYQLAELFQEVIAQNLPTPFLEHLLDLLDGHMIQPYKHQLTDWIILF